MFKVLCPGSAQNNISYPNICEYKPMTKLMNQCLGTAVEIVAIRYVTALYNLQA